MRDPYMKFQNCILINFERTHGWTDKPKAICPFNFSKVEGIIASSNQWRLDMFNEPSQTHSIKPDGMIHWYTKGYGMLSKSKSVHMLRS